MLIGKLLTIHFQTLGPNTSGKLERNLLGTRLVLDSSVVYAF